MKNVFVLCTGRCGSVTFAKAAEHISNFSAGHETRSHMLGIDRFAYPRHHIEVDNRLSWFLGRLDKTFGRDAFYVHLTRDPVLVARSFAARSERGIMSAYARDILMAGERKNASADSFDFAKDYVDTVTSNIQQFLRDKPRKMNFRLEQATSDTLLFWDAIGAEGDLKVACETWTERHNATSH